MFVFWSDCIICKLCCLFLCKTLFSTRPIYMFSLRLHQVLVKVLSSKLQSDADEDGDKQSNKEHHPMKIQKNTRYISICFIDFIVCTTC